MSLVLDKIKGHTEIRQRLKSLASYPACLVFSGPAGIGRRLVAEEYFCQVNAGSPAALSAVEGGDRTGFVVITPDGSTISVDQIRQLVTLCELNPYPFKYRVVVVDEAERLTFEAASALLKLLEEPPFGWTLFVLVVTATSSLLPTIRSRSIIWQFRPLSVKDVEAVLVDRGLVEAKELASFSLGSVGMGLALSGERPREVFYSIMSYLRAGKSVRVYEAFKMIDTFGAEDWPYVFAAVRWFARSLSSGNGDVGAWSGLSGSRVRSFLISVSGFLSAGNRQLNWKLQSKSLMLASMFCARGQLLPLWAGEKS